MKAGILLLSAVIIFGCTRSSSDELAVIDTGKFEIEVPSDWEYEKEDGIDSFVGRIEGNYVSLYFDWSWLGYANELVPTVEEYVYAEQAEWMPIIPYAEDGVIYTSGSVQGEKERIMKEKGITGDSLVRVEAIQTPETKIEFKNGTYSATLTYSDTIVEFDIKIPDDIKNHKIRVDTIGNFKRKLVRPRVGLEGITGMYLEDLNSGLNFQISGYIDDSVEQDKAIAAFKTIKMKK